MIGFGRISMSNLKKKRIRCSSGLEYKKLWMVFGILSTFRTKPRKVCLSFGFDESPSCPRMSFCFGDKEKTGYFCENEDPIVVFIELESL